MSLQTRLSALITAIGADVKALQARTPTVLVNSSGLSDTSEPTKAVEWWRSAVLIAKLTAFTPVENSTIPDRTDLYLRVKSRTGGATLDRLLLNSDGNTMLHPPVVAALPTTGPGTNAALVDGQECYLTPDSVNFPGVVWHMKYRTADSKWWFLGGAPIHKLQAADFTTCTSTTFVTDANSPSWVNPWAGDFDVTFATGLADNTVDGQQLWYTAATSIAGASDARSIRARLSNGFGAERTIRLTGLSGGTIAMYARVGANTGRMFDRSLRITPVRIS